MSEFTSSDPRCLATLEKLARARARMKKLGIRSLLDGRPAWARINPMGKKQDANVIDMKRRHK